MSAHAQLIDLFLDSAENIEFGTSWQTFLKILLSEQTFPLFVFGFFGVAFFGLVLFWGFSVVFWGVFLVVVLVWGGVGVLRGCFV